MPWVRRDLDPVRRPCDCSPRCSSFHLQALATSSIVRRSGRLLALLLIPACKSVPPNLPGVLTMDAVDASDIPEELKKNCDVWVPQLGRFDNQMELIRDRIQSGHDVWFYTCLFPNKRYLNRLIDYPLLKVRLLHWLNFRYGFTGFLHWGWNYWTPEPVKDTQPVIDANTQLLPPGDAFIVYPDRAGKSVYSSIRLEAMREGIEDYELLLLLKQKNPAASNNFPRLPWHSSRNMCTIRRRSAK